MGQVHSSLLEYWQASGDSLWYWRLSRVGPQCFPIAVSAQGYSSKDECLASMAALRRVDDALTVEIEEP